MPWAAESSGFRLTFQQLLIN